MLNRTNKSKKHVHIHLNVYIWMYKNIYKSEWSKSTNLDRCSLLSRTKTILQQTNKKYVHCWDNENKPIFVLRKRTKNLSKPTCTSQPKNKDCGKKKKTFCLSLLLHFVAFCWLKVIKNNSAPLNNSSTQMVCMTVEVNVMNRSFILGPPLEKWYMDVGGSPVCVKEH